MSNKLDRLVAEKVMGWTVNKERSPYQWFVPLDQGLLYECWDQTPATKTEEFSTDIAAAWEVVEHLRTRKDEPMVITALDNDDGEYVIAFAKRDDRWTTRNIGKHRDAPMAIGLAALRAVGVPEATIQEACK